MARRPAVSEKAEAYQIGLDEAAQEKGPSLTHPVSVIVRDYLHTEHPDTSLPVVFVPGEALPKWAHHLVQEE
jgi:hypothetical protein